MTFRVDFVYVDYDGDRGDDEADDHGLDDEVDGLMVLLATVRTIVVMSMVAASFSYEDSDYEGARRHHVDVVVAAVGMSQDSIVCPGFGWDFERVGTFLPSFGNLTAETNTGTDANAGKHNASLLLFCSRHVFLKSFLSQVEGRRGKERNEGGKKARKTQREARAQAKRSGKPRDGHG